MADIGSDVSLDALEAFHNLVRSFFSEYEVRRIKEIRASRKRKPAMRAVEGKPRHKPIAKELDASAREGQPNGDPVSKPAPLQAHSPVSAADIDMSFWTDRAKAGSEQSED